MERPRKKSKLEVSHPLGVKPEGNALLEVDSLPEHRVATMGLFGHLNDVTLMLILQELDKQSLLSLSHTCKSMFAYCWFDELWKQIIYASKSSELRWLGSWRTSALGLRKDQQASVDCKGVVYSDFLHRPFELSEINYGDYIDTSKPGNIPFYDEEYVIKEFDAKLFKSPFVTKLASPIAEWTIEHLVAKFGNETFRQEYMDWPLSVYKDYCEENHDETPLYLFDCKSRAHQSLEFSLPLKEIWANRDLFTLFGSDRPDHQWLIMGPKRSGSTFHKDPNATSAWNSVISGHKYWIMFPSASPPPGVWTNNDQSEVTAPASLAEWFASGLYKEARNLDSFYDAITGPGQVMYVPSGWWHAVVNLDDCIAMTGNFVVEPFLEKVVTFLKEKPDQISGFRDCDDVFVKFQQLLGDARPDLADKLAMHDKSKRPKWNEIAKTSDTFTFGF